jgi:hypothetical protein
LTRKFAEASLPDSRINANSGNEVPPSSTSTETQREQLRSLLGRSQTELERSNVLTPLQDFGLRELRSAPPHWDTILSAAHKNNVRKREVNTLFLLLCTFYYLDIGR